MNNKSTTVRIGKFAAGLASAVAPELAARALERLFLTPSRHAAPSWELDWLRTANRSELRFDESRWLPIYSWGSGPTVLLVHGWSGRGSQLAVLAEPLVQRGYRVVCFDAPAHGAADGRLSGLPELAIAVERVARRVGPIHAIVAHSLGAAAATIALSRGLVAERLVYVAPPVNPRAYLYRAARYLGFNDQIACRAQERIEQRFDFSFADARATSLAPKLDIPLLIVHDLKDREVPYAEGAHLAEKWPGAKMMSTIGLGHLRILREPAVARAVLGFLCDQSESGGHSQDQTREAAA